MDPTNAQDEWDAMTDDAARNAALMQYIENADEGTIKKASAAGTNMIRRRIREEGFFRRILPPQDIDNSKLHPVIDHDRPVRIESMEPDSKGAISIPFSASADATPFYGDKFQCVFHEIATPEFYKDINELRTYDHDLRRLVTDNSLRDVQTREDGDAISMVDEIVGATDGVGLAGVQQNFTMSTKITRDAYVDILSILEDQNLNNGTFLCNRKTAKEFLKFKREDIGGDLAEKLFKSGLSGLEESTVMGVRHIFTIKRDLVPDGVIYLFAAPTTTNRRQRCRRLRPPVSRSTCSQGTF